MAQLASGETPNTRIPRGNHFDPQPGRKPPPPTVSPRCQRQEVGPRSRAPNTPPFPAMTQVIVESRGEAERGVCRWRPPGLGFGFVIGRTHDSQRRTERQDAVALAFGGSAQTPGPGPRRRRSGPPAPRPGRGARRGGDDPLLSCLAHTGDECGSPTQLERTGSLQGLELEPNIRACTTAQRRRWE